MGKKRYSDEQVAGWADVIPGLMLLFGGNWTKVAVALGLGGRPAEADKWVSLERTGDNRSADKRKKMFQGFDSAAARKSLDSLRQHASIQAAYDLGQALLLDAIEETCNKAAMGLSRGVNTNAGTKRLAAAIPERWNVTQHVAVSEGGFAAGADELKREKRANKRANDDGDDRPALIGSILKVVVYDE